MNNGQGACLARCLTHRAAVQLADYCGEAHNPADLNEITEFAA